MKYIFKAFELCKNFTKHINMIYLSKSLYYRLNEIILFSTTHYTRRYFVLQLMLKIKILTQLFFDVELNHCTSSNIIALYEW